MHRIRTAMVKSGSIERLDGIVEADRNTYVGGLGKNMHVEKRKRLGMTRGRKTNNKTCVMGMMQRGGKVKAKVIKRADAKTLHFSFSIT